MTLRVMWVTRLPDLTYELGPALIPISARAGEALAPPGLLAAELERLADRVGCAARLSTIHRNRLMVNALTGDRGPVPAGISAGTRLPLDPPSGAAMIAHADPARQSAWLSRASIDARAEFEDVLSAIRRNGVGVWVRGANMSAMTLIAQAVQVLSEHPSNAALSERLIALFSWLIGSAYDVENTAETIAVSLITAPVFQIAPFNPAVARSVREQMIAEITTAASDLGRVMATVRSPIGHHGPADSASKISR
jgi:hypothetical protein